MTQNEIIEIETDGGAEVTIAAMDKYSYTNIGESTYRFVRRLMQNPEYKAMIKARAAELKAAGIC